MKLPDILEKEPSLILQYFTTQTVGDLRPVSQILRNIISNYPWRSTICVSHYSNWLTCYPNAKTLYLRERNTLTSKSTNYANKPAPAVEKLISKGTMEYITHFPNLQILHSYHNCFIIEKELTNLKYLEHLKIFQCTSIINGIIPQLKQLKSLQLIDCGNMFTDNDVNGLINLNTFEIEGSGSFGDNSIINMTNLTKLNIGYSYAHITNAALAKLKKLQYLKVTSDDVTDDGLQHLKNINKLIISESNNITGQCFAYMPNLQKLNAICCNRLNNNIISQIHFNHLHTLDVSYCEQLTDEIFHQNNMPKLQTLNITGCTGMTNATFTNREFPELRKLYIAHCEQFTDIIFAKLNQLEILNMSSCVAITDAAVSNLTNLRKLYMADCNQISDNAFTNLRHLKCLSITSNKITNVIFQNGSLDNLEYISINSKNINIDLILKLPKLQKYEIW